MEVAVGERFVDRFYAAMDGQRTTVRGFYTDASAILWNGNAMMLPQLVEFLAAYPTSTHTVHSFDIQPVYGGSILVSVKGVVKLGDQHPKQFAQSFTLVPVPGAGQDYVVANDAFRFV
ncbi:hypothetical protein DFJ74DRAFT_668647 [Hyaloraphidium curvatum]|nr:hypothetical protein DFJ74DRAFT_668647 [Hyaloraphidium curvatum]